MVLQNSKNHPYGEFTTQESLENVTFEDVVEYHKTYYIPNNAYLVVVGDVTAKGIKPVLKEKFEGWKKGKLPVNPEPSYTENVALTEINFIDVPSATQSTVIFTNNTQLKQSDEDYFAGLIANQILGGGSEGYLFKNLRDDNGWTYGSTWKQANRFREIRINPMETTGYPPPARPTPCPNGPDPVGIT